MYKIETILDDDDLQELLQQFDVGCLKATITNSEGRAGVDISIRNTDNAPVRPEWFPEIVDKLADYLNDGTIVSQLDLLSYGVGGRFAKHTDDIGGLYQSGRKWSTVTMLDRSSDLQGGDLIIEDDHVVRLNIGETVIFKSNLHHEVTPITQGYRKVLVAWLG